VVSLIVSLNVVAVSDSVDQQITDIYRIGNNIPSGSAFASQVMPPSLARYKDTVYLGNPFIRDSLRHSLRLKPISAARARALST